MSPKNLDTEFASVDDGDGSKHEARSKAPGTRKKPAGKKDKGKVEKKGKGDKKTFAGRAPPKGDTAKQRFDVMEKTYNSEILKYIKGTSQIEVRCFETMYLPFWGGTITFDNQSNDLTLDLL